MERNDYTQYACFPILSNSYFLSKNRVFMFFFRKHEKNYIEQDAKLVDKLLSSAKMGQWDSVWAILGNRDNPKRDRLFNVIPENRRWGIIHQAVYWNNIHILRKLLQYPACDSDMRAKQCTSECGKTSRMNAAGIAQAYGYTDMSAVLSSHQNEIKKQIIPTFQPLDNYTQSEGLGLITVTLAAYKKAFHPKQVDPNKSVITILGDIFNDMCQSDKRWKDIQDKVCD